MSTLEVILDITAEHCPMTLVKSRLKFESLKKGAVLKILIKDENTFLSLVQSFKDLNILVLKTLKNKDGFFEVNIKK
ncbi:MAG: sulfurtransferase TusA family protein [Candidatus Margulisiibacteriota bacterium]|jgi:TusA-related sulfurtransferase